MHVTLNTINNVVSATCERYSFLNMHYLGESQVSSNYIALTRDFYFGTFMSCCPRYSIRTHVRNECTYLRRGYKLRTG